MKIPTQDADSMKALKKAACKKDCPKCREKMDAAVENADSKKRMIELMHNKELAALAKNDSTLDDHNIHSH